MLSKEPNLTQAESHHKKIITIDDEAPIRHLISHSLRRERYNVVEAGNGREGLEVIRKEMPDLIVMDVMMPEMNGFETLKAIRSDGSIAHIPVLFLTGFMDKDKINQALQIPHTDYLAKPFVLSVLKQRISKLLTDAGLQQNSSEA